MTLDDNAGDRPAAADPAWLDSLFILLMRRRDLSAVLPLTVIVEEIAEWGELRAADLAVAREDHPHGAWRLS